MFRIAITLVACCCLHGCYYMQAAAGQLEVLRKREPVAELINDPATPADLKRRLQMLSAARDFSIAELGLPDNESYRSYTDLGRRYVIWNVIAAPEFSLQPKTWCYPVAGCVNYRGYFSQDAAYKKAARLGRDGYDVAVGGVAAYSTLGRFSDPILNTMMNWDDVDLVGTLFHELAHQMVYVKGDTGFNESFATAVAEIGVKRWLDSIGNAEAFEQYTARRDLRRRQVELIAAARDDLDIIYASAVGDDEKRERKAERIERLKAEVAQLAGGKEGSWLSGQTNNAHLVSVTLYEGKLPFFRQLLDECNEDLLCFYAAVRERAGRSPAERYD